MTRRQRRIAIRVCELVAVVATQLAVVLVIVNGIGGGGGGDSRGAATKQGTREVKLAPNGDADHDGVPNGKDLQPLVPAKHKPGAQPTALAQTSAGPRPDCARRGISRHGGEQGTCIDSQGHRIEVVDRATPLDLKEMDVSLAPIELRHHVGSGTNRLEAAGVYVVVTATVRNKLHEATQFRPSQMLLVLGPHTYQDDTAAEGLVRGTFLRNLRPIPPGETRTGTVIFDVRPRSARRLTRDGNVVVVQFDDPSYEDAYNTVGFFRTYR